MVSIFIRRNDDETLLSICAIGIFESLKPLLGDSDSVVRMKATEVLDIISSMRNLLNFCIS